MRSSDNFIKLIVTFLAWIQAGQARSQLVTLTVDYNYQRVSNNVGQNVYADPCLSQGIIIESLQIIVAKKCSESGFKHLLNSTDQNEKEKRLVRYIQKECVGRPQCELQETWNIRPTLKCNGSEIPIDNIIIQGKCVQTNVDNKTVSDLQIQTLNFTNNLVIVSKSKTINRICQLTSHVNKIKITLLYVDFDTSKSVNNEKIFSITDTETNYFRCLDSERISKLIQQVYINVTNATLEFFLNDGFLWMEIEAQNASLVCQENSVNESSCLKPTDIPSSTNKNKSSREESDESNSMLTTIIVSVVVAIVFVLSILILMRLIMFCRRDSMKKKNRNVSETLDKNRVNKYDLSKTKILMLSDLEVEQQKSPKTEKQVDRTYFQLEKDPDTCKFILEDNIKKSASGDDVNENENQLQDYSHLHFTGKQKPQKTENMYNV